MANGASGPWQVSGVRHSGDLRIGRDTRLLAVGPDGDAVAMVFFDMKTGRGQKEARLISAVIDLCDALQAQHDLETTRCPTRIQAAKVAEMRRSALVKAGVI